MAAVLAEVTRGTSVESVHYGHVAVVNGDGRLIAFAGDPAWRPFFRSSAKPFQAVPLLASGAADAYGFTTEEIALSAASHNATPRHQAIVASMLEKAGLNEGDLRCGFSTPLDEEEGARITLGRARRSQVACECSGEHAGMLAACRFSGWAIDDYIAPDHPLQRLIRSIVAAACGVDPSSLEEATDGCSIPTFGAALQDFARAYAVLADPDHAGWTGEPAWREALRRIREAVLLHPELVSGEGEIDTALMAETGGLVLAKLGAEGLLCLAIPDRGVGIAISDVGGSTRSLGPAALAVLEELKVIDGPTRDRLWERLCPPVETFVGESVGATRPAVDLEWVAPG